MKKATALTLAGLMAISAASNATMSRINGFGESGKFVADNTDMWTWPSVVASNPDTTYLEWGKLANDPGLGGGNAYGNPSNPLVPGSGLFDANKVWGGSNLALGPGVLGIWYNRPYSKQSNELGTGFYGQSIMGNGGSVSYPTQGLSGGLLGYLSTLPPSLFSTPQNQIDLVYGFAVGGATIGVGLNRATNSVKEEQTDNTGTTTVNNSADSFGISLGAALKDLGAIKELDLGLQFDSSSAMIGDKDSTGEEKITQDGSEINFRAGVDLGGNIVDLNVNSEGRSTKVAPASTYTIPADSYVKLDESAFDLNLGWAMTKSSDKGMGLGGFVFDMKNQGRDAANMNGPKVADKLSINTLSLDAVCGSEFKAKDWLTLRTGLSGTLYQTMSGDYDQTDAANALVSKSTWSSTAGRPAVITVGSSLILGDVVVDAIANQDFLFSGPYFVSGVPNGLNLAVSATMKWGGAKE